MFFPACPGCGVRVSGGGKPRCVFPLCRVCKSDYGWLKSIFGFCGWHRPRVVCLFGASPHLLPVSRGSRRAPPLTTKANNASAVRRVGGRSAKNQCLPLSARPWERTEGSRMVETGGKAGFSDQDCFHLNAGRNHK